MGIYSAYEPFIEANGAVVPVDIWLTEAQRLQFTAAGKALPKPENTLAQFDTGAHQSAVDPSIVAAFGVARLPNDVLIRVPGQPAQPFPAYELEITIPTTTPKNGKMTLVCVVAAMSSTPKCLLGRDALTKGILVYDGTEKRWSISM